MDYIRNNTGQVSKLPYEGVVARFNRLYLNRDISGLKKEAQAEAMQFVQRAPCPVCGGSGLNPAALASKINGRNISDYYAMMYVPVVAASRLECHVRQKNRSLAEFRQRVQE